MSKYPISYWQCPLFSASPSERMGWIEEQIEEGEGWLMGQKAYKRLSENFRVFDGIFNDKTKSILITNELKYDIRKFCATLSDIREIGTYGSDAPQYKPLVELENKLLKNVYLESEFPYAIRRVLQYATVCGRGYLWTKCKTADYGWGERQIVFQPLGLLDVLPVQTPSNNDVQCAYINHVYDYLPIVEAHARFPLAQKRLQPINRMRFTSGVASRRVDHTERFRYGDEIRHFGDLYCEIRYTFIRDITINDGKKFGRNVLPMGDVGTSWFYKVPFVGMDIPGGFKDGQPVMRKAEAMDCRLYPQLRLIITNKGMSEPIYDGPAYDWHGIMPAVQYDVDDYPWMGVGNSLVGDVGSIMSTTRKIERKMDQVITASLNPPMGYDRTAVGGPKVEHFDLFEEDVRAGFDGEPQKVMQSLLPDSVKVEEIHFKFLELLAGRMGKQLGLEDVANIANLKMNIASDTADKMLESIGPVARDIAGNVERGNARVALQLKTMIPQWFDVRRVVSILGPDNLTKEVFDFDPTSLIPSHMPDEIVAGNFPTRPSDYSTLERARAYARNVRVTSVPSTLVRITQMQEQLKWLQLKRGDAPVSWSTTMKKLDVENYGEVDGLTEREKWINEQMEDVKIKAAMAAEMQKLGLLPPPGAGDQKGGGKGKKGRPPTGGAAPKIKQKGDGRTTVTESK